jgi:hypothetical protein
VVSGKCLCLRLCVLAIKLSGVDRARYQMLSGVYGMSFRMKSRQQPDLEKGWGAS